MLFRSDIATGKWNKLVQYSNYVSRDSMAIAEVQRGASVGSYLRAPLTREFWARALKV